MTRCHSLTHEASSPWRCGGAGTRGVGEGERSGCGGVDPATPALVSAHGRGHAPVRAPPFLPPPKKQPKKCKLILAGNFRVSPPQVGYATAAGLELSEKTAERTGGALEEGAREKVPRIKCLPGSRASPSGRTAPACDLTLAQCPVPQPRTRTVTKRLCVTRT